MFETGISEQEFFPNVLFVSKAMCTGNEIIQCHDFMEITYVLSGKGKYTLDNRTFEIMQGDLLLVNPGVEHMSIVISAKIPLILLSVCFKGFRIIGMEEDCIVLPDNKQILHPKGEFQKKVDDICNNMWLERSQKSIGRYYMVRNYVSQLVILILRSAYQKQFNVPVEDKAENRDGKFNSVLFIRDFMDNNYYEKITLKDLADKVNMSQIYLNTIFKDVIGMSPIHYLIQLRLSTAKTIIKQNPIISIKEVARKVGYEDVSHFSKMFKKQFGISPSFYRKKKRLSG